MIARYRVSTNPDQADASSEIVLLRVQQPFSTHKGGQIRFGPDGFLYIGLGDGGSGGDPLGNGQSLSPGSICNPRGGEKLRMERHGGPALLPAGFRASVVNATSFVSGMTTGSLATVFASGVITRWLTRRARWCSRAAARR